MSTGKRDQGTYADPFEQEDASDFMQGLVSEGKQYLDAQKQYYALLASQRAADMAGGIVSRVVMAVLLGSVGMFLNIAAALWVGDRLHDRSLGFLLVGVFYLLVLLVFAWWWRSGGRDRFSLNLINDLYHGKD